MRLSIRTKAMILTISGITIISAIFSILLFTTQEEEFLRGVDSKLRSGATMARYVAGTDYHDRIVDHTSISDDEYQAIVGRFSEISRTLGFQYLWSSLVLGDGTIVFTTATSVAKDVSKGDFAKFFDAHSDPDAFSQAIESGKETFSTFQNKWGHGRMVLVPHTDAKGRTYVFGASLPIKDLEESIAEKMRQSLMLFLVTLIVGSGAAHAFSERLARSLRKLHQAAEAIAQGDFDVKTDDLKGSAEISALGANFTKMGEALKARYDTERRLVESEARFYTLFNSSPDPIWIIEDSKFVECNRAAVACLGYPDKESLLNTHPSEISPKHQPDGQDSFEKAEKMIKLARENGLHQFEWTHTRRDGGSFVSEVTLSSITLDGRPVIHCLWRDITERKNTERELLRHRQDLEKLVEERTARLRLSEQRLSAHIENTPLGVISWNEKFECTLWNDSAKRIFGFSSDEAIGHNALKLLVPEEIHDQIDLVFDQLMKQSGGSHSINENVTKDGRVILCEWFNTPLTDEKGKSIGVASIVQDITEQKKVEAKLKESEETFRSFYEVIPDVFMITDVENAMCVDVNGGFERVTGFSRNEVVGKSTLDLHLWERNEDREKLVESLVSEGSINNLAANFRRKDGTIWPGIMSGCTVMYHGRLHALTATKDVSDIRRSQRDAEAANQAKSAFLANMSHEVRTPMNGIVGMAEILSRTELKSEQARMLYTIQKSSKSLLRILDDILDISKVEAGKVSLSPEPVFLEGIVEGIIDTMRPIARERNVRLYLYYDTSLPNQILADPVRLRQVLMNLLSNAIKFSQVSGENDLGQVHIRLDRTAADEMTIEVADRGVGMSDDVLSNLFQPFYQGEESTTRVYGGTGLGLVITKNLVEMMGGRISAQSQMGEGATFTVTLPMSVSEGHAIEHDISDLVLLGISATDSLRYVLGVYCQAYCKSIEFAEIEDELEAMIEASKGPIIVLLGLDSIAENEGLRARLSEDGGRIKFLLFAMNRLDARRCGLPSCFTVQYYPVMPSELRRGLAILAGRASPAIEYDDSAQDSDDVAIGGAEDKLILVVEDNETNQDVISTQLKILGFGVEVAGNGFEGLELWKSGRFDLVLADCHMPVMDGFEMTKEIRNHEQEQAWQRVPIIAITANALKGEAERCVSAGMDDYLSKPVEIARLRNTLMRWLSQRVDANASADGNSNSDSGTLEHTRDPVDPTIMKEILGSEKPALFARMMTSFVKKAGADVKSLLDALDSGDSERAGMLAHKLKSAARSIGAGEFSDHCAMIELGAKEGHALETKESGDRLKHLFHEVDMFVREYSRAHSE